MNATVFYTKFKKISKALKTYCVVASPWLGFYTFFRYFFSRTSCPENLSRDTIERNDFATQTFDTSLNRSLKPDWTPWYTQLLSALPAFPGSLGNGSHKV